MTRQGAVTALKILAGALGRKLDDDTVTAYLVVINRRLTDEEFGERVSRYLKTKRDNFWPPPAVFLDTPTDSDNEIAGLEIFDRIVGLCNSNPRDGARWIEPRFGPHAARVFKALGGAAAIREASVDALRFLARDFTRLWSAEIRKGHNAALPKGRYERPAISSGSGVSDQGVRGGAAERDAHSRLLTQGSESESDNGGQATTYPSPREDE